MSKEVMQQAQLLCEWIAEAPHQRGSINGLAAQVLHSISAALAAPQRQPLTPEVPRDANINQRLSFTAGWKAAEAAHGITKGPEA